jgi:signal transduction histidine kinase
MNFNRLFSLRARIILLVLLAIIPALGFILYMAAEQERIMLRHIIGLSIVFLLALSAAWVFGDLFILRKLRSLLSATQRLRDGDLSARTGLAYGTGELSQLARAFDLMASVLEQREDERKRAQEDVLRHNRDLAALNTVTAAVSSSLDLPEVLESLKNLLEEQLNVPGGIIFFYDETDGSLYLEAAWGVPAAILAACKRFQAKEGHYTQVVQYKESVLHPDLRLVEPFAGLELHVARPTWQSYLSVPLLSKGEVQGVLDLFSLSPIVFTQDHVTLFTALGQQVGIAIQNARLFEKLRAGRKRLEILSQQLLEVQEAERRHISRELHDEIGQALTALKVNLQAAQRLSDLRALSPYLEESISIVERTLHQVRNLSLDLRPSLLDDLGVVAALRWYVDRQAQRAGFEAQFIAEPQEMRLPPDLETTCFRLVQEALTNVVRHARAQRVQVILRHNQAGLELVIRDDGVGFDVNAVKDRMPGDRSLGLLGMQERVQLVDGQIKIESDPNRGTEIRAIFPLSAHEPALD